MHRNMDLRKFYEYYTEKDIYHFKIKINSYDFVPQP